MNYTEIVNKLIGNINPIGESNTDDARYNNLKEMCQLASNLIEQIKAVAIEKESNEYSVKRAANFADKFLTETVEIFG
jgi:hypothetical protein